jgi:hypothetical protein
MILRAKIDFGAGHVPRCSTRNKSLFASFSSEKEDSSFLKKRSKKLLFFGVG